jgi:hypothetical protein
MRAHFARSALVLALPFVLLACGGKTDDGGSGTYGDASSDVSADVSIDTTPIPDVAKDAPSDGSPGDLAACTGGGQCELASPGCCGAPCGVPKLSDYVGIHKGNESAYKSLTCADPGGTPCPGCAVRPDPNLTAFCIGTRCTAIDVRTDPVSACKTDADCRLRYAPCCECGASDPHELIALAVSQASAYMNQVCDPSETCAKCATAYPASEKAICDAATGHCMVSPPPL